MGASGTCVDFFSCSWRGGYCRGLKLSRSVCKLVLSAYFVLSFKPRWKIEATTDIKLENKSVRVSKEYSKGTDEASKLKNIWISNVYLSKKGMSKDHRHEALQRGKGRE